MFGRHPHVIQLGFILPNYQSVETENLIVFLRHEDLIGSDKVRRDCEVVLPVLDPVFRVTPMSFGVMSQLSQVIGVG